MAARDKVGEDRVARAATGVDDDMGGGGDRVDWAESIGHSNQRRCQQG